jgi:hypothetical protein
VRLPTGCESIGPVCGCNGVTYPSLCLGARADTAITTTISACPGG